MTQIDDLILITVDDHLIEPPDLFADHLDAKYQDRAPKLERNEAGSDVWVFNGIAMETVALNAVAGRPKEEYGMEPQSLDEVRPGCYDVHERVKDMDAGGVLASMNFPSFPTFTARVFQTEDLDLSRALVRAYNDWHIDEWCGAYPARFIPMAVPMMWDPGSAPTRCAAAPPRAATRSASPRTPPPSACPASTTSTGIRSGRPASTPAPCCRSTSARRAGSRSRPPTPRPT